MPPTKPKERARVRVTGLRANKTNNTLRCDPSSMAQRCDPTQALLPKEEREAIFQKDLLREFRGLECASCGHIRPKASFTICARSPVEYDAVCLVCRDKMMAPSREAKIREAATEREAKRLKRSVRREEARNLARNREGRRKRNLKETKQQQTDQRRLTTLRQRLQATDMANVPPEVQRELIARELCRRSLVRFTQRFEGLELVETDESSFLRDTGRGLHLGWFHIFVLNKLQKFLQDVVEGKQPNLMLFTPPRHGKSTMASRLFPAWALGRFPHLEFIAASYGSALPLEFSRFVRGVVQEKAFNAVFPRCQMRSDKQNLTGWGTTRNGQYLPAGVGTGVMGRGADVFLIDDPVRDQQEADSEIIQQRNMEWYLSVALTRLSPRSGKVIIQTRWSDNDISGQLERTMHTELRNIADAHHDEVEYIKANVPSQADRLNALKKAHEQRVKDESMVEQWEIIRFPAIADQDEYITEDKRLVHSPEEGAIQVRKAGDPLHKERFSWERLERTRRNYFHHGEERIWNALYQQRPSEGSSVHFTKDMFTQEPDVSAARFHNWTIVQAWDPAIGTNRTNDWTVGGTGAIDPQGVLHVLNRQRFRGGPAEIAEAVIAEYETYHDLCSKSVFQLGIEYGQILLALEDSLEHALAKANEERKKLGKEPLPVPPYPTNPEDRLMPISDKEVRATPSKGWHRSGRVRYPMGATWFENLRDEHTGFLAGARYDDNVDFMSWLVRLARRAPRPREKKREDVRRYGKYKSFRHRLKETYREQVGRSGGGFMSA